VGGQGGHGGALLVTGEATVGELRRSALSRAASPVFLVTDVQARLTGGPRLSVTVK